MTDATHTPWKKVDDDEYVLDESALGMNEGVLYQVSLMDRAVLTENRHELEDTIEPVFVQFTERALLMMRTKGISVDTSMQRLTSELSEHADEKGEPFAVSPYTGLLYYQLAYDGVTCDIFYYTIINAHVVIAGAEHLSPGDQTPHGTLDAEGFTSLERETREELDDWLTKNDIIDVYGSEHRDTLVLTGRSADKKHYRKILRGVDNDARGADHH